MYQLRDTNNGSVQVVCDDYRAIELAQAMLLQLGVECEIIVLFN